MKDEREPTILVLRGAYDDGPAELGRPMHGTGGFNGRYRFMGFRIGRIRSALQRLTDATQEVNNQPTEESEP